MLLLSFPAVNEKQKDDVITFLQSLYQKEKAATRTANDCFISNLEN